MTCHGAEFALARRKPWIAECLRRSLLKADRLIANSSDTASHIHKLSGRDADVLPFGSSVVAKKNQPTDNEIPRLLFTGRLIQRKGVEYLLRALKLVLADQPVELVITGDGDQRSRLEALAAQLQLGESVRFLGYVDSEQLADEYARCDVWINPSIVDDRGDTEGLGVGAIEAYAHGKPVIASEVGGIPDAVIHNKTGLLVPEKDEYSLAAAIERLLSDPAERRRLAECGQRLVEEKFSWPGITDQLEGIYSECLRAKRVTSLSGPYIRKVPRGDRHGTPYPIWDRLTRRSM